MKAGDSIDILNTLRQSGSTHQRQRNMKSICKPHCLTGLLAVFRRYALSGHLRGPAFYFMHGDYIKKIESGEAVSKSRSNCSFQS